VGAAALGVAAHLFVSSRYVRECASVHQFIGASAHQRISDTAAA